MIEPNQDELVVELVAALSLAELWLCNGMPTVEMTEEYPLPVLHAACEKAGYDVYARIKLCDERFTKKDPPTPPYSDLRRRG